MLLTAILKYGVSFDPYQVNARAHRHPTDIEREQYGLTRIDVNPSSFEEAQEWARDYMVRRGRWLDRYIETLRQYSHSSRHALWIME